VKGCVTDGYSFFSSHAATSFAMATFVFLSLRKKYVSAIVFIWAILYAYSRIYLGVHFFGDVILGVIFGIFCGWFAYKIQNIVFGKKLTVCKFN
jgi:undecaprenyl-diphosphatase